MFSVPNLMQFWANTLISCLSLWPNLLFIALIFYIDFPIHRPVNLLSTILFIFLFLCLTRTTSDENSFKYVNISYYIYIYFLFCFHTTTTIATTNLADKQTKQHAPTQIQHHCIDKFFVKKLVQQMGCCCCFITNLNQNIQISSCIFVSCVSWAKSKQLLPSFKLKRNNNNNNNDEELLWWW